MTHSALKTPKNVRLLTVFVRFYTLLIYKDI